MSLITVKHLANDAFRIDIRGHKVLVDQPGSDEVGATPVELFVASVAACAGYYAERFLRRHGLPSDGLRVHCEWTMRAGQPARVARIAIRVNPPDGLPPELRNPLLDAVHQCTVTNSLHQHPQIDLEVVSAAVALSSPVDEP